MKGDVCNLAVIVMQTVIILTTVLSEARRINLQKDGGMITIKKVKTDRSDEYAFPGKHWNFDEIMRIDVTVLQPSANDNLTIGAVGQVKASGCYLLLQRIGRTQRLFSESCDLEEERARESGCQFVGNLKNFRLYTNITRAIPKRLAYRVWYKVLNCSADLTITPWDVRVVEETATDFQDKTSTTNTWTTTTATSNEETSHSITKTSPEWMIRRIPIQKAIQTHPDRAESTATSRSEFDSVSQTDATACVGCGRNYTVIVLSVALGVLLLAVVIIAVLVYRRKRKKKTSHSSFLTREASTVHSFGVGTSAVTIPRNDVLVTFSSRTRNDNTTERYTFSPRLQARLASSHSTNSDEIGLVKDQRRATSFADSWSESTPNENVYEMADENSGGDVMPGPPLPPRINETSQPKTFSRFQTDQPSTSQPADLSRSYNSELPKPAYTNLPSTSNPDYQNLATDIAKNGGYMRMKVLPDFNSSSAAYATIANMHNGMMIPEGSSIVRTPLPGTDRPNCN